MLLPPPPRSFPLGKYLCHRGVAPSIVHEIADVFRSDDPRLIVQKGDALSLSLAQFRRAAFYHLQRDSNYLIVLLSKDFPGPVYSQTFGSNLEWALGERGRRAHAVLIRVDDCEIGKLDVSADLSGIRSRARRRELILGSLGRRWFGLVECLAVRIAAMDRTGS